MNDQFRSKVINLSVAQPGNSQARAGPISVAVALGLACVARLDLDCFDARPDSPGPVQRFPDYKYFTLLDSTH